jgi:hypothetical protein
MLNRHEKGGAASSYLAQLLFMDALFAQGGACSWVAGRNVYPAIVRGLTMVSSMQLK